MKQEKEFALSGVLSGTELEYCVAGVARHGFLSTLEKGITAVGEDAILHLPEYGLFGVFDGAGGATDVGSPRVASQTAARAVKEFFMNEYSKELENKQVRLELETVDFFKGAMDFARKRVNANRNAGLTTALFVAVDKFDGNSKVLYANAGDGSLLLYPDPAFDDYISDDIQWIAGDQEDVAGNPANILGRVPKNIQITDSDQFGFRDINADRERLLILCSDGVTGSYHVDDGIDGADIEFATRVQPLIEALQEKPLFQRALLRVERRLGKKIDVTSLTWDDWERVKPFVDKMMYSSAEILRRQELADIASRLLTPELVRPDIFPPRRMQDDKSLIILRIPATRTL
jgi:serine/threonine protein phosphatase PrpC